MAQRLTADLVLRGGKVRTLDGSGTIAEAVATRGDEIVAVGSDEDLSEVVGPSTEIVDLRGRTVLPGLTDCHVHLASDAGRAVGAVDCRDLYMPEIASVEDVLTRVRAAAGERPSSDWIKVRASPLQDMRMRERRFPTLAEVDEAAPNNPVAIAFGPHVTLVNSAALQASNINLDTPNPQGGVIARDEHTGALNGMLQERAQLLVGGRGSPVGPDALAERILDELNRCASRGVTCIHDILINQTEMQAYQRLARAGRLPVRVHAMPRVIEADFDFESLLDLGLETGFGSDWLRVGGAKMSIDGGFTGKAGYFSEPIEAPDGEEHPGIVRITQEELDDAVWRYHDVGMRCLLHTIGDAAMDMALEAYEKALARKPWPNHRHRMEHFGNWMITPERLERVLRLGLVLVPNPPFLRHFGDPLVEMLGTRMTEQGFPFRTLYDAGVRFAFGSDSPGYFPVDPLRDAGTAMTHATLSGARVNPREDLSQEQALRVITNGAAYAGFVERQTGSIAVGRWADLAVLGEDLDQVPPEDWRLLPVDITIAGGKARFGREGNGL